MKPPKRSDIKKTIPNKGLLSITPLKLDKSGLSDPNQDPETSDNNELNKKQREELEIKKQEARIQQLKVDECEIDDNQREMLLNYMLPNTKFTKNKETMFESTWNHLRPKTSDPYLRYTYNYIYLYSQSLPDINSRPGSTPIISQASGKILNRNIQSAYLLHKTRLQPSDL